MAALTKQPRDEWWVPNILGGLSGSMGWLLGSIDDLIRSGVKINESRVLGSKPAILIDRRDREGAKPPSWYKPTINPGVNVAAETQARNIATQNAARVRIQPLTICR